MKSHRNPFVCCIIHEEIIAQIFEILTFTLTYIQIEKKNFFGTNSLKNSLNFFDSTAASLNI